MRQDHFDEPVAARYDEDEAAMFDPAVVEPAVAFLAALAGDGAALELAVGTGRLALPLRARGVEVHGVDLSEAMVARLRSKPGGDAVPVVIGDITTVELDRRYALVYLVFNTIMNLTTQDDQVACVANAARHLEPRGRFVVEVMVPELQHLAGGERVRGHALTDATVDLDTYDVATQGLVSTHLRRQGGAFARRDVPFRYVWPAELDLMARLAGLGLEARYAAWDRTPFTATSPSHVSVYLGS